MNTSRAELAEGSRPLKEHVMTELGVVYRNIKRADRATTDELAKHGAATVHEAMGRIGLMKPYLRPIYSGAQASGTAVTVLLHPGDNWMMHVVAEQINPGDMVVAAVTAESTDGYFGDPLATSFKARGARGLIIDAGVRDVEGADRDGLPRVEQGHQRQGDRQGYDRFGQHSSRLRRRTCQPGRRYRRGR